MKTCVVDWEDGSLGMSFVVENVEYDVGLKVKRNTTQRYSVIEPGMMVVKIGTEENIANRPFKECIGLLQGALKPIQIHFRHPVQKVVPIPNEYHLEWDGVAKLPFTLKKKSNGDIRVNRILEVNSVNQNSFVIEAGDQLVAVGNVSILSLDLKEVKQMMHAMPKPVHLSFQKSDILDGMTQDMSTISLSKPTITAQRHRSAPVTIPQQNSTKELRRSLDNTSFVLGNSPSVSPPLLNRPARTSINDIMLSKVISV